MEILTLEKYQEQFKGKKRQKALERAWKNRDFEIELYWKRATYFWAFTAATFAAYFVVLSKEGNESDLGQTEYLKLIVAIMGLIFSLAWVQVNRGSKKWQENWEKHVDLLEDKVTGPIYKTVLVRNSPSVSGTNLKISQFVTAIWTLLIITYFDLPEKIILELSLTELYGILIGLYFTLDLLGFRKWLLLKLKPKNGEYEFEVRTLNYKQSKKKDQTDNTISKN